MKKLIEFIKEEVIGSENTFHAWSVLTAVAIIIAIGFYLNSPNASFQGVAGSRESNVNFESAVEIKRVHVIPGQRVQKGELLIELNASELNTQLRQLKAMIEKLKAERSVREQMNKVVGNTAKALSEDPLSVEISKLEEERAELERQRDNLYVFAEIDGIVGSVNFKRGERAPSFSSLVTILPDTPTFVQGFVYEQMNSNVKPGNVVTISSLSTEGSSVQGRVVSVGSRFVQIPPRLAPSPNVVIWGREVMVEIPKENRILLGERVQITPRSRLFPSLVAQANSEDSLGTEGAAPVPVRLPKELAERTNFEASGAIYLADLKKYLVVSDDTDSSDTPMLFLMSEDGEVDAKPVAISGLPALVDAESISAEGDYVYVMSSLSIKRKGDILGARGLLVRAKRDGAALSGVQTVEIGALLRKLIQESSHPILRAIAEAGLDTFEVEAQSVRDGALYIGLKAPQTVDSASVILRLSNVDELFRGKHAGGSAPELEVWKTVKVSGADARGSQRLSDMTFVDSTLYFTTTCQEKLCGGVWSISENESQPRLVRSYSTQSPEGVAYNSSRNELMLTFDLGEKGSLYTTVPGLRGRRP